AYTCVYSHAEFRFGDISCLDPATKLENKRHTIDLIYSWLRVYLLHSRYAYLAAYRPFSDHHPYPRTNLFYYDKFEAGNNQADWRR
ncbi:MAG: hypothetical protein KAU83_06755, partial [Bacteroidales bacterium]|nr:hypothetical protein [Bacteroidales bacterium]